MQLTRGRNKVRNIYAQGTPNATDNFASPHPTAISSNIHRLRHHNLLLLRAALLVLGSRLREDDGGAGLSVAMLLLHPPGLCRSGLGGLAVDIHLCTIVRSPVYKTRTMYRFIERHEGGSTYPRRRQWPSRHRFDRL